MNARLSRPGRRLFTGASVALALCAAIAVLAQPGRAMGENLMAVQPDGRILVAGVATPAGGALARYLPDGSLDPSFGRGGIAIDRRVGSFAAMSLQADGRILAAAPRGGRLDPSLGRYLADGRPDASFGEDGLAVEPAGGSIGSIPTTILAEPDGRIFVAANLPGGKYKPTTAAAVTAYSASGDFERTLLSLFNGSLVASIKANDILPGTGLVAGSHPSPGEPVVERQSLLRLQAGTPAGYEPAFGGGQGISLGPDGEARAIATDATGRLLVVGGSASPYAPASHGTLARYAADGTLDPSFGAGGVVEMALPGAEAVSLSAVAVDPDGSIVVVGGATVAGSSATCAGCRVGVVARFRADGSFDTSFGMGPLLLGPSTFPDRRLPAMTAADVAILSDGSILVRGAAAKATGPVILARLTPQGQLDPSFGNGGVVTTNPGGPTRGGAARVDLRVEKLRSGRPTLRVLVRQRSASTRIKSVRVVLPAALRLHPRRIERNGGVTPDGGVHPQITRRAISYVLPAGRRYLSVFAGKGAFSAAKRLGAKQRLTFRVQVGLTGQEPGSQAFRFTRRP